MSTPIIQRSKHAKCRINMQPSPKGCTQIGNRNQIIKISGVNSPGRGNHQFGLGRTGRKPVFKIRNIGFFGSGLGRNLGKIIAANSSNRQILDHTGGKNFKPRQGPGTIGIDINANLLPAPLPPGNQPQKVRNRRPGG